MLDDLLASLLSPQTETLVIFQAILIIAALGHYLPLSINQLDIGIPGYMAVGAYSSSVLTIRFAAPFVLAILTAGGLAAVVALLVDSLAARSNARGFAFAIISIGSFEVIQVALTNWKYVGGGLGMSGMPQYTTPTIVLIVLVLAIVFLLTLNRSYIGRAMGAIRDDERAAEAMGIHVLRTKLFVFGCGAFLGGVSGALYAHYALYIEPGYFGFGRLIAIQLPIVFGGLETFWGAIAGMIVLGLLPEYLRGFQDYRLIFTALATIAIILIKPNGLVSRATVGWIEDQAIRSSRWVWSRARGRRRVGEPAVRTGAGGA